MLRSRQIALSRSSQCVESQATASTGGAQNAKPNKHCCLGEPGDHVDQAGRDEVHRHRQRRRRHAAIEVPGYLKVGRELRVLEMADPRRAEAGSGQLVVEPSRRPVTDVGAERGVQRAQDLPQDEHDADDAEGNGQRLVMLDGGDQEACRDREPCRQQAAQRQQRPPAGCHRPVGTPERGRELQFLPSSEPPQGRDLH